MSIIQLTDVTLSAAANGKQHTLTFKETIEIAKKLDGLNISAIMLPQINGSKTEALLVRTIAGVLKNSATALTVGMTKASIDEAWKAISLARKPQLTVSLPISAVQMEYICHIKPAKMPEKIKELVSYAASLCPNVNFTAEDATRASFDYLVQTVTTALEAGATSITICDTAGTSLPDEMAHIVTALREQIPTLKNKTLTVRCMNTLGLSAACAIAAVKAGASGIEVACQGDAASSVESILAIIANRGDSMHISSATPVTELHRTVDQIRNILREQHATVAPVIARGGSEGVYFDRNDSADTIAKAVRQLGYDLSDEDNQKVYDSFARAASSKKIGTKELEAIVAAVALQVPPTYKLINFVITNGSQFGATATIITEKNGTEQTGLAKGDGPIDAAFLAIEQIVGSRYELDDFQVQSVTEGKEAMGTALIRLRAGGKLYSGTGVSTDIISASLYAYLAAINKIAYEEKI
ncbi:MAG: hypothetical protein E7616_02425 [Ruminococcaceae bacterium]|nr:hypothetical protein [Oscillospiraceae bacterium]